MFKYSKIIIICFIAIFIQNCNKKEKIDNSNIANLSDQKLFELGNNYFENSKYKEAKKYFIKITTEFPYSKFAAKAQYLEALANYRSDDYDSALISLDEYIKLYPAGEDIEDAYYMRALCHYNQISSFKYDQSSTIMSLEAFNDLQNRFPDGKFSTEIKLKIDLLHDQLASQNMSIAFFYYKKGNVIAALNRYNIVIKDYPTTIYIEEALYRMVEIYMMLNQPTEAKKYAQLLGTNYVNSEWYLKSYNLINRK